MKSLRLCLALLTFLGIFSCRGTSCQDQVEEYFAPLTLENSSNGLKDGDTAKLPLREVLFETDKSFFFLTLTVAKVVTPGNPRRYV